jgi:hypothetical protein
MEVIYQQTTTAPIFTDSKYLWESGIISQSTLPIPEPGDTAYNLSRSIRALSRGLRSGNCIEFLQVIDFEFQINNPAKIDRDYRYYKAKDYCGTYQVLRDGIATELGHTGFFEVSDGRSRLINKFRVNVLSEYISHEWLQQQLQISGQLKSCNFDLAPSFFPDPVSGTLVAGFSLVPAEEDKPNAVLEFDRRFLWTNDNEAYPYSALGNTGTYYPALDLSGFWYNLGLYLYEGADIISITEAIGLDVLVPIEIPPTLARSISINPSCGAQPSCDAQWDIALAANPGWVSQAACEAISGVDCFVGEWVCPSDPTYTKPIWFGQGT